MKEDPLNFSRKQLTKKGSLHWLHWFAIISSLGLTFFAWHFSTLQIQNQNEELFDRIANKAVAEIRGQMQRYEEALWAGVAFIKGSGDVTDYPSWKAFATSLEIHEKHPGINGIGVIYQIDPKERESFIQKQKEFRPYFDIHPKHKNPETWPITLIEPYLGNEKAVGLDMAFETNRHSSIVKSKNGGKTVITGPIVLVQDSKKTPGFLFYAPFYKDGGVNTLESRQERFLGVVYAPFIVSKLLAGTLDDAERQVGLTILDQDEVLFNENTPGKESFDPTPLFTKNYSISLYSREWTIKIQSNLFFRNTVYNNQSSIILIGGLLINFMLITLFVSLAKGNKQALSYADTITAQLNKKTRALTQSNEELEQFAYRTSHDLRSPLRTALGFCDILERDLSHERYEKLPFLLEKITSNLHRLDHLVVRILESYRVDAKPEAPVVVDIAALVAGIIGDYEQEIKERNIIIKTDIKSANKIFIESSRFQQIITNLVGNAIKYSDPKKNNSWVSISTKMSKNEELTLIVSDNGTGIPEKCQPNIFSMFFRAHSDGSSGSGLGLYIVKKTVGILQGEISFQSSPTGTTFTVTIPTI